jgi:diacylglycerol kinase (ATP)
MDADPHAPPAQALKNKPFATRLGFAAAGIALAARRERSFRTQAAIGATALLAVAILRPGLVWAAIALLSTALVLSLEMANAALEALIDHLHPGIAPEIGRAKDMAAGAVLLASLASLGIGVFMLLSCLPT